MQQGWKRRRDMEAAIGREALRRIRESRTGGSNIDREEPRLARVARLAADPSEEAIEELCLMTDADAFGDADEVRFAARVALRSTICARNHPMLPEDYDA